MIVTVKQGSNPQQVKRLTSWIKSLGLDVHVSEGEKSTVIGLVGDTSKVDIDLIRSLDIVEAVFGGKHFQMIAGPCSVESEQQVIGIAEAVKASGATMLRGGAFKPRTSPYAFQGLGLKGLEILKKAREVTGLPIVTEIMSERYIDAFAEVDMVQIGARNMQNFDLLKAVGRLGKPVLLKRGLANTIEEWLMSAEYIMSEGNMNIVLCERGIRTFEPYTRNTLDLSAIPILKEKTHLPVIVDPSHASGLSRLVKPMSLASVGAGADGLIIEVHNDPPHALCDGAQSLRPEQFDDVVKAIDVMLPLVNKERG